MNTTELLEAARRYSALGFSVLPLRGATKRPAGEWKELQSRRATDAELVEWFRDGSDHQLGMVCGAVSGGLLAIDFDVPSFAMALNSILKVRHPDLYAKFKSAVTVTTRKGYHILLRCKSIVPPNEVLAHALIPIPEGANIVTRGNSEYVEISEKQLPITIVDGERRAVVAAVETRGEGGYVVAPPSEPYKIVRGQYDALPTLSADDIDTLFSTTRILTELHPSVKKTITGGDAMRDSERPGDAYSAEADPLSILTASGWSVATVTDPADPGKIFLSRPGKTDGGVSATWGGSGKRLLYVFSANARPFDAGSAYSPFAIRTLLEFGGDYAACARALRGEGYGKGNDMKLSVIQTEKGTSEVPVGATVAIKVGGKKGAVQAAPQEQVMSAEWDIPVPLVSGGVPPFPTEVFPPMLRDFTLAAAHSIQVPVDLVGALVFGMTSTLVSKVALVQVKDSYREHLNLFFASVLPPASRKTAAFSLCTKSLVNLETRIQKEEAEAVHEYQTRLRILTARREDALKRLEKSEDADAQVELAQLERELRGLKPVNKTTLWADDITPEALASVMADNDGRMAILSAEGGVFDMIAGRYSGRPNLEVYLKGHAHDALRVQRKGNGNGGTSMTIEDPSLTMCVTVQPTVLSELTGKSVLTGRGLMARFIYVYPADLAGHRLIDTDDIPPALLSAYDGYVRRLGQYRPAQNEFGDSEPHPILLTADARRLRNEFDQEMERRYAAGGDLAGIREWAGKLLGNTVRVAGLLHLMHHIDAANPWDYPLEGTTMADAIKVGRYAIEHARAAHNEMRADANVASALKLLEWMREKNIAQFTARDVLRGLSAFQSNADLAGPLQTLVDHEYIRVTPGGRSERYDVNPSAFVGEAAALPIAPAAPVLAETYSVPTEVTDGGVSTVRNQGNAEPASEQGELCNEDERLDASDWDLDLQPENALNSKVWQGDDF